VAELDADGRFRKSGEQRILIELLLLRFAYLESTVSIEDVMAALGGRGGTGGNGGGGGGGSSAPRPAPDAPAARPFERPAASAPASAPATAAASTPSWGDGPARDATPGALSGSPGLATSPVPGEVEAAAPAPAPAVSADAAPMAGPEPVATPSAPAPVAATGSSADVPAARPVAVEPAEVISTSSADDEFDFPPLVLPNEAEYVEPAPVPAAPPAPTPAPAAQATAAETPTASAAAAGDVGPIDGARLRRAWTNVLQEGDGLAAGMAPLLRAAQVSAQGRTVTLALPPTHPALERLSSAAAKRGIEEALARRLGGAVTLELATGAAAAVDPRQGRITAESAKKARLDRMMEGEPVLAAAVQALDLELVD
jgi:hypothetical protein